MSLPPLVPPTGDLDAEGLARYSRQIVLGEIGVTGQRRLAAARVLVIGAGGLGSPVLQYLAAAGVGTIGVVDSDDVELSNLHRQVIHPVGSIGRPKVDSAADAIAALNPGVTVHRHHLRLDPTTVAEVIAGYDLVIDGADNFPTRYLVNDACVDAGLPLVWGSVLGFAAQVAVFWDAAPDGQGIQLRDVFPEPPAAGLVPSCAEAGVIGALVAQAGSVMAMEAIKLITGLGVPLLGRILVIDSLAGRWDQVPVRRASADGVTASPTSRSSASTGPDDRGGGSPGPTLRPEVAASLVDAPRGPTIPTTHPAAVGMRLPERDTAFLLDVRGPDEFAAGAVPGSVNVPLPRLLDGVLDEVPDDGPILVICRSGARAEVAAASLIARGYTDVRVLEGGLLALAASDG
ncbi:MAG TPA: molybdopterin-synthase adenylyltransferase MoeB [Micropruina sp.]|nr:molybdopterin-synthase adenylyltransferase MoeB [Micropruina sp.]